VADERFDLFHAKPTYEGRPGLYLDGWRKSDARRSHQWKDAASPMPARLRPISPFAADAILVGDPGRALLLAQELLEKPKMSNHARGLWGYTARTPEGRELTIQSTGIGGPSAALVLSDLAELGVRRAVRVGTCAAFGAQAKPAELLLAREALASGGSAASFGVAAGEAVSPNPELFERLHAALGAGARTATVASLDTMPTGAVGGASAADMQTLAVLARSAQLGIAAAAVLIVAEIEPGGRVGEDDLEAAAKLAGRAVVEALSNPQVEG
jgi:uridine phosphorylase